MAALLGYLVALTVFLSGGYLGLEWLASPDVGTHTQSGEKPTSHRQDHALKRTAPSIATEKDAAVVTKPDTPAARRGKPGDDLAVAAEATGDTSKNSQKPDGVPARGCMPIGLTANGQMVFPLQCRELIERQHPPLTPNSVATIAPSLTSKETGTHGDNIATGAPKQPGPSANALSADKNAEESDKTTGSNGSKHEGQKDPEHLATASSTISPTNVVVSNPPKPNAQRSVAAKPKRPERMRSGQDRTKLVAMTLETLRFEDGHLEHRLVPLKPSARTAMQTDWYNPLGLR